MESKTENLSVGQSFKNYKDLCKQLDEITKAGKSKQLQLKEWKRYFGFHKNGNKFIINEIYSEPKEKIDNRKGNSGTSQGSRNNNDIYGQYIDKVLLDYFADCEKSVLDTTTNQLSFHGGLINCNYSLASRNKDKYYNYTDKEMNSVINKVALWDFFGIIKTAIKKIIRSSLNRLASEGYINFEEAYMLSYNYQSRIASDVEESIIRKIENSVLEDMQVTRNKLQYNDKLRNEYYSDVEKLVIQEIEYVDKFYIGYKIIILKRTKDESLKENKAKVNELFRERTKEKLAKIPIKTKEKVGGYIGKPNPFWGKYTCERLNFNYLIYADYLIKSLLNLDFKVIKEEIIRQKAVSNKKIEKKKMVKEFIAIEEDEEMKDLWMDLYKEDLT